jgi:uncharacterized membrane protein
VSNILYSYIYIHICRAESGFGLQAFLSNVLAISFGSFSHVATVVIYVILSSSVIPTFRS